MAPNVLPTQKIGLPKQAVYKKISSMYINCNAQVYVLQRIIFVYAPLEVPFFDTFCSHCYSSRSHLPLSLPTTSPLPALKAAETFLSSTTRLGAYRYERSSSA